MGAPLPLQDRLAIMEVLVKAGLHRPEATAFVSLKGVPAHSDAKLLVEELERRPQVGFRFCGEFRGAGRAIACGVANLDYVISVSEGHSQANVPSQHRRGHSRLRGNRAAHPTGMWSTGGHFGDVLGPCLQRPHFSHAHRRGRAAGGRARRGPDLLADTIGTATPFVRPPLLHAVREALPNSGIAVHFHNTRGSGLACLSAAGQVRSPQLEASVGGLGGCPFAPGASGQWDRASCSEPPCRPEMPRTLVGKLHKKRLHAEITDKVTAELATTTGGNP